MAAGSGTGAEESGLRAPVSRKTSIRNHKGIVVAKKMSRKVSRRVGEIGLHSRSSDLTSELQSSVRSDEVVIATEQLQGCLRCLLLVMCTYPVAKESLTLYLARSEGHERYFGCNLMHRKVLASSYQHLMAEAPNCA